MSPPGAQRQGGAGVPCRRRWGLGGGQQEPSGHSHHSLWGDGLQGSVHIVPDKEECFWRWNL